MANHTRTVKTDIWVEHNFRKLDGVQKIVWFYLHTGYHTSETALFACSLSDLAHFCGISKRKATEIISGFIEEGLADYDYETDEILVKDYFEFHAPSSGLYYNMYLQDLEKIKSQRLVDELIEMSKKYRISTAFFLALLDVRPDIDRNDFKIIATDKSDDAIRNAGLRGRTISLEKRTKTNKTELQNQVTEEITDPDLPF